MIADSPAVDGPAAAGRSNRPVGVGAHGHHPVDHQRIDNVTGARDRATGGVTVTACRPRSRCADRSAHSKRPNAGPSTRPSPTRGRQWNRFMAGSRATWKRSRRRSRRCRCRGRTGHLVVRRAVADLVEPAMEFGWQAAAARTPRQRGYRGEVPRLRRPVALGRRARRGHRRVPGVSRGVGADIAAA